MTVDGWNGSQGNKKRPAGTLRGFLLPYSSGITDYSGGIIQNKRRMAVEGGSEVEIYGTSCSINSFRRNKS
mgnify:CR=1 FL=1